MLRHSITPSLHHSITPSLHHSITPSLHHSISPSLHHSVWDPADSGARQIKVPATSLGSIVPRRQTLIITWLNGRSPGGVAFRPARGVSASPLPSTLALL